MSLTDLDRFKAACVYPGELDEQAVERELAAFLRALGVSRLVVRLRAGQGPEDPTPPNRDIEWILAECIRRNFGVGASRAVLVFSPARRIRATYDDAADFVSDVGSYRVARGALDALAARRASDAGAADAALGPAAIDARGPALAAFAVFAPLAVFAAFAFFVADSPVSRAVVAGIAGLWAVALGAATGVTFAGLGCVAVGAALTFLEGDPGSTVPAAVSLAVAALAEVAVLSHRRAAGAADPARAFDGFAADPGARAMRTNRRGSTWELSWTVCVLFDAVERRKPAVEAWLRPLFEAFVCGCWLLYWTDDTLYWVAKPTVHREPGTQRLHHDARAALESDVVNLHVWHGVRVPQLAILYPGLITIADIDRETNAEVRRVMIERYRHGEEIHGAAAFIRDAGGESLDHDERYGTLWRCNFFVGAGDERRLDDEPIVMIELVNRTREPDGRFKRYWLRVPPTMRTAREAVAWTFNMPAEQYAPERET